MSARSSDGASALPRRLAGGSPKGAQLREILEGLTGSLAPGSALPSERELADRYGVARMTVRTELDRLTADGLAYRIQGRGTFVAEPRVAQAMALTSFTEDMRTRGLRPSAQLLVRDEHEAGEAMARRLQLRPGSPVVRVDRLRLADDEPLAVEQVTLSLERFPRPPRPTSRPRRCSSCWRTAGARARPRPTSACWPWRSWTRTPRCWGWTRAIRGCGSRR